MKQRIAVAGLFIMVALLMNGCAALGVMSPETFNEKAAAAQITVTGIRTSALDLLKAKRITATDAQNVQDQADIGRKGIDVARQIQKTDPAGANARLSATIAALEAVQTYLRSRGGN